MPGLFDHDVEPAKAIIIGESGTGKTGAKAALLCAGYRIMSLDTDNGRRLLRALMSDEVHYPYARICRDRGIDLNETYNAIPISTFMVPRSITRSVKVGNSYQNITERALVPKDGKAWTRIIDILAKWVDPTTKRDYGSIDSWGPETLLDFDSFTTISRQAYYFNQEFNGRLGALEDGYTHQKDVGGAQSQLRRLLETIFSPELKSNVLLNCHIRGLDDSRGFNQTPEQRKMEDPEALVEVKGFPQSVGVALSKQVSIYFNDSFVFEQSGSGINTRRTINTVPTTISGITVGAKNSAWLERTYPQESGLASIFAALRGQPKPTDLIDAIQKGFKR